MSLHIIILAAGQGKRMFSKIPKVLHVVGGKPMLDRVVETAQTLNPKAIHVIYGHGGEQIKEASSHLEVNWVFQENQLGTGHAVLQALPHIPSKTQVLILSADVPLIQVSTLTSLLNRSKQYSAHQMPLHLLIATVEDSSGFGRIIRNQQEEICAIVEEKEASPAQKQIKEIHTGICCVNSDDLTRLLPTLSNNNAQGEYYLTEMISLALQKNLPAKAMTVSDNIEIQGVNTRTQLHQLERIWQQRLAHQLLESGVSIADKDRIDIRGELFCGEDVFIDINTVFYGKVSLGNGSRIGPNCVLNNVHMGENCEILANSVLEHCSIANDCHIGPFARLRPGTNLASHCKIGNFVETKNATLDRDTKVNHLSYLGDVTIGKDVNIGAGTITCNYNGVDKHQTIIEDGAFIGSDTQLIAPVTVGAYATIGAGSTIRKNVPSGELTITESKQKTIFGWKRPIKKNSDQGV